MFWQVMFGAGNQGNHQNFEKSLLTNKLWHVFMGMKQKKFFFFWKKKFKMADSKKRSKTSFSSSANSQYFFMKFSWIGWAKSIPFASINPTNPRTHPAQFCKEILRIDRLAKWGFFEAAILNFFFQRNIFFCFIPMKISHKLCVRIDGTQFLRLWWFMAKNQSPQTYQPAVY